MHVFYILWTIEIITLEFSR